MDGVDNGESSSDGSSSSDDDDGMGEARSKRKSALRESDRKALLGMGEEDMEDEENAGAFTGKVMQFMYCPGVYVNCLNHSKTRKSLFGFLLIFFF